MDGLAIVIATTGPLLGVLLGGVLAERAAERSWQREQRTQNRTERREVYSRFLIAGRLWQSNVLGPEPVIRADPTGRIPPYADAREAYGQTIQAMAEIRLVAGGTEIVNAAAAWEESLRELGRVRATGSSNAAVEAALHSCKEAEQTFVRTARDELKDSGRQPVPSV